MPLLTLDIPEDRYPEFLVMAGTWLGGDTSGPDTTAPSRGPWTPNDGDLAQEVLRKMTPAARRLFGLLAAGDGDTEDGRWTASALVVALGLTNANELAGMFAWPGRYCYQAGRGLPFTWENTEDRGAIYGMSEDIGGMFLGALKVIDHGLWLQINGDPDA